MYNKYNIPQVFSPVWFNNHQHKLISLLNHESSYIREYFRYTVGISTDYDRALIHSFGRDNFHVYESADKSTGVFYSRKPFAERLYYSYLPIWKMCHIFDTVFANRWFPDLNLGFDTLTSYPQVGSGGSNDTCDGSITFE